MQQLVALCCPDQTVCHNFVDQFADHTQQGDATVVVGVGAVPFLVDVDDYTPEVLVRIGGGIKDELNEGLQHIGQWLAAILQELIDKAIRRAASLAVLEAAHGIYHLTCLNGKVELWQALVGINGECCILLHLLLHMLVVHLVKCRARSSCRTGKCCTVANIAAVGHECCCDICIRGSNCTSFGVAHHVH